MAKITFSELTDIFTRYNKEHRSEVTQLGNNHLKGAIVFKSSNWPDEDYSIEARTYIVQSDNKYFMPDMVGNSLFGNSLDGSDRGVLLDLCLESWEIDYCYMINY